MNHIAEHGSYSKAPPTLSPYGGDLDPTTNEMAVTDIPMRSLESDPGRDLFKSIAGPYSTLLRNAVPCKVPALTEGTSAKLGRG
jgi:type I restriction enzyme M protein